METLSLKWADIETDARVIHLRVSKSGRPRAIPYAEWPELAAVIEGRAAVAERLKRAAVNHAVGLLLQRSRSRSAAVSTMRPAGSCSKPPGGVATARATAQ